jgi:hypothetical protein
MVGQSCGSANNAALTRAWRGLINPQRERRMHCACTRFIEHVRPERDPGRALVVSSANRHSFRAQLAEGQIRRGPGLVAVSSRYSSGAVSARNVVALTL